MSTAVFEAAPVWVESSGKKRRRTRTGPSFVAIEESGQTHQNLQKYHSYRSKSDHFATPQTNSACPGGWF